MTHIPLQARIVVADDHHVVRAAIAALLGAIPGLQVVGEAADGAELIEQVRQRQPDIVLVDVAMPRMSGIEATRVIREHFPRVGVIMLSMSEEAHVVKRAIDAGAHGYILKGATTGELERAVHGVLTRGEYHNPELRALLAEYSRTALHEQLSPRQQEVLRRLARGQAAKEIAYDLGLSSKTVDAHRARIMEKLGLSDAASLTRYAVRHGLVEP